MDEIKFSITIPAFKAKYFEETIKSCLSQTYQNFEIIIVDDCSPEDLKSIVEPFLSDSRVRYYRNDKNFGAVDVVDNWNKCLSYCTGQYVICMGDDDRLMPDCLSEYANLIKKYPDCKVFHALTQIIDENGEITSLLEPRPEWESGIAFLWRRWGRGCMQFIGDFCFEVDDLRRNGGFYKQPLAWASDDITTFRAAMSKGVANTQSYCFQYRVNRMTITKSGRMDLKLEAKKLEITWYNKNLPSYQFQHKDDEIILKFLNDTCMSSYFKRDIENIMILGVSQSFSNFWLLIKRRDEYSLTNRQILKVFLKSIKKRIL